jgi:hypothetical protein
MHLKPVHSWLAHYFATQHKATVTDDITATTHKSVCWLSQAMPRSAKVVQGTRMFGKGPATSQDCIQRTADLTEGLSHFCSNRND